MSLMLNDNSQELILFPSTALEFKNGQIKQKEQEEEIDNNLININEEEGEEIKHLNLLTDEQQNTQEQNKKMEYKDQIAEIESEEEADNSIRMHKKQLEKTNNQPIQQSLDNQEQLKLIVKEARSELGDSNLIRGKENRLLSTPKKRKQNMNHNYQNLDEQINLNSIDLEFKLQEQIPRAIIGDPDKNIISMILENKKQQKSQKNEELKYIRGFFKDDHQKFMQSRMFGGFKNQQQMLQEKRSKELEKGEQEKKFNLQYLNQRKNQGMKSGIGTFFQLRESTHFFQKQLQQGEGNVNKRHDIQEELKCINEQSEFKRLQEKFILQFNKKPEEGINFLIDQNVIQDTPSDIAGILLTNEGLSKQAIGQLFTSPKDWNQNIMKKYMEMIDFGKMEMDIALRELCALFQIPQEAQQIDRIITQFAIAYWADNPDEFIHENEPYLLANGLILLNGSLYNQNVKKQQSKEEFCSVIMCAWPDMKRYKEKLEAMFDRIKAKKLETNVDGIEMIYNRLHPAQSEINVEDAEVIDNLQKGNTFLKYGRKGKPKQRLVYLSKPDQKIYWRAPNNPNETPRSIKIEEIKDLCIGCTTTQVMIKHKIPKLQDQFCFSFITKNRTLDLQAYDKQIRNI